jgi:hypothetical protein
MTTRSVTALAHDREYPEEVLRSAWNPDLESAGRARAHPRRAAAARTPCAPPPAWVEGLLEEIASL